MVTWWRGSELVLATYDHYLSIKCDAQRRRASVEEFHEATLCEEVRNPHARKMEEWARNGADLKANRTQRTGCES